jgi:hypothetical protein
MAKQFAVERRKVKEGLIVDKRYYSQLFASCAHEVA